MATSVSGPKHPFTDYAARVKELEQEQDDSSVDALNRVDLKLFETLFNAAKRLSEGNIFEDEAYQILQQRKVFKENFKDNLFCSTEYAAFRALSKQLQAEFPWAKNRVEKRGFEWSTIERKMALMNFLSQKAPVPRTDVALVNLGPYIDLPPSTKDALEQEFSVCYRALYDLGKTRAGNFYRIGEGVYAHRNYPFVFRVASKELVETQLQTNQQLREFIEVRNLNFIKVPQSTSLNLKGHPDKKIYVEHKIEGMIHPVQVDSFWSNIQYNYIYDPDSPNHVNLKTNLQTLVHQLAVLVGKYPYPTRGKGDFATYAFVGSDASAVYATSIFSSFFGIEPKESDAKAGLDGLVRLFPLNSLLNHGVLKEFPDHPIPKQLEHRITEPKSFITHDSKWREPDVPLAVKPVPPPAAPPEPPKPKYVIKMEGKAEDDLYLRGEKGDLNWGKGVKMTFDKGMWTFETDNDPGEFKVLKGDSDWEKAAQNHTVNADSPLIYSPEF